MKRPKIDLSKQGLQTFFLHHIEKVILVLALAGFLAFLWLGFSTPRFADTDPEKLSRQADSASSHIKKTDAWDKIEAKRVAFDKADKTLANMSDIDHSIYPFGIIRGTRMETLGLRMDPVYAKDGKPAITKVEYDVARVPVFINNISGDDAPIDELESAFSRRSQQTSRRREKPKYGNKVTDLQTLAIAGVQPEILGINSSRHLASVINLVSVRGLINIKEMWDEYKSKLENAVGYYPERDRPTFNVLEIQRKPAGAPASAWTDVTGKMIRLTRDRYAKTAPEVIPLENYNSVLCSPIPPIAMMDYRRIANHSSLKMRDFRASIDSLRTPMQEEEPDEEDERKESGQKDDIFSSSRDGQDQEDEESRDDSAEDMLTSMGSNRKIYQQLAELEMDGPLADYKVLRFFDLGVESNKKYEYRVRVWLDDPNHEFSGEVSAGGDRRNSRGGGRDGGGRSGLGDGDIRGSGGGGGAGIGGDGPPPSRGGGRGGPPGGRGGPPGGRGGPPGGRGGDPRGGGGIGRGGGRGEQEETPKRQYTKVPIVESMLDIKVRNRIDAEKASKENDSFKEMVLEEMDVDLDYSRPTGWVTITVEVPELESANVVVGNAFDFDIKGKPKPITFGNEPSTELLVGEMAGRFGTLVTSYVRAFRGDFLSPEVDDEKGTNILNLVDQTVRKLTGFTFKSRKLVLDIIKSDAPWRYPDSEAPYTTPGEVLVMDLDGKFTVHNAAEDRAKFLNWRFQPDQSNEYNLKHRRSQRSPMQDRGGGRGGFGGRGGDDDEGNDRGPFGGGGRGGGGRR